MKKKLFSLLLALALCLSAASAAFASGFSSEYSRVLDMAGLLTQSEYNALLERLDEISLRQKLDVVVATTDSIGQYTRVRDYADDLYDQCGFGYGNEHDGLVLVISMEERDWYISTCGYGITAFTDAGIRYIGERIVSDLSDGRYADAFETFAALCDDFITQSRNGSAYDAENLPREPLSSVWIPISLGIGLILALLTVLILKAQLKTVRSQPSATNYLRDGSLNISQCRDLFLYSSVSRTRRPEPSQSSGSSTHTSSSGTSHGGGGGKF